MVTALHAAQCENIIEKLPDGIDTLIGTEGTYLSGGEQQRVALARAILKDAPIVVLDEATAFADPENEALIHKAFAALTNCDEFVTRLPQGYATPIGENGARLSGGERQRISIARALLKNAPIVLLDEATASLDVENETRVQGALSRLLRGKTVLVIAHRMRTVEAADHIVVLAEGKVVEEGKPDELLQRDGSVFQTMTRLQTQSAAWRV